MKMWNCHFLMILTFTFDINFTKGIKWITEPLLVNKCKDQTANLTWKYTKEPDEEIKQLQWIFNGTTVIAYSSMTQGFNVEPNYKGRVNRSGETGILLHNISSKDIGNYTLYLLMKWEDSPNKQTVQLNVRDAALEPDCSCAKLSNFPKERNGETYQIVVGSCNLEINSSFCCPVGLVSQYCVDDPSKFCKPIRDPYNVTESTTQSRNVTHEGDPADENKLHIDLLNQKSTINSVLGISIVCMLVMLIIMVILLHVCRFLHQMNSKRRSLDGSRFGPQEDRDSSYTSYLGCFICGAAEQDCDLNHVFAVPKRHYATTDDREIELEEPLSVFAVSKRHYATTDDREIELEEPLSACAVPTLHCAQTEDREIELEETWSVHKHHLATTHDMDRHCEIPMSELKKTTMWTSVSEDKQESLIEMQDVNHKTTP